MMPLAADYQALEVKRHLYQGSDNQRFKQQKYPEYSFAGLISWYLRHLCPPPFPPNPDMRFICIRIKSDTVESIQPIA